ncbi:Eukaryotic/viral aspartic protease [Phytophthora megakarya]|uniref:Eukaryotic/viral aspartic protease n=1 Tax=Phytophthora megakarya TaxID=4795 RepID=A0A225V8V2_9STRA|nr:Eukaryotic/viral aspartic protease [Phytophthora megakarya]
MAKGSSMTVPATPAKSGIHDNYDSTPGTDDLVTTGRLVSFEDSVFDPDANDEDEYVHGDDVLEAKTPSGGERLLVRNIADEFGEIDSLEPAEDNVDDFNEYSKSSTNMAQLPTKKDGHRPPINGDTPVANKTTGQCLNAMQETNTWIQLFSPKPARQAVWTELVEELSYPVNSSSTEQVTADTVSLLTAMGMTTHAYPSKLALED